MARKVARVLVYGYYNLPYAIRMKVADELGLIDPVRDKNLDEKMMDRKIFSRAVTENKLDDMMAKIADELDIFEEHDQATKLRDILNERANPTTD